MSQYPSGPFLSSFCIFTGTYSVFKEWCLSGWMGTTSDRIIFAFALVLLLLRKTTLCYFFFLNLFILRERENQQRRGWQKGRDRIPSRFHAISVEPNVGLNLMNQWLEPKSRVGCLTEPPGRPHIVLFLFNYIYVSRDKVESDLIFLGLLILENRLKEETKPVLEELISARIRTVMITGI